MCRSLSLPDIGQTSTVLILLFLWHSSILTVSIEMDLTWSCSLLYGAEQTNSCWLI